MPTEEEIRELIEKARGGDRTAFEVLVALYRAQLRTVVDLRLGPELRGRTTADDIIQETFLRAWRGIARFEMREAKSFPRWLSGIAVRVILEAASAPARHEQLALGEDPPARSDTPTRALRREERFERLERALESLSPDYREAVTLVRIRGLTVAEAAKRMGRTPNALSHIILRALRKLREIFGETESFGLPQRSLYAKDEGDRGAKEETAEGSKREKR